MDIVSMWGIDEEFFRLVILPLLIFFARIMDVSINTVRIIYMLNGKKFISTFLGFFESLVWLLAIGQIFQNIDSAITYFAYAGGFATGVYVGMIIEERLAVGTVLIRVIMQDSVDLLSEYLTSLKMKHTIVEGTSEKAKVSVLFTIIRRSRLDATLVKIKELNPTAFYTVEGVKKISEEEVLSNGSKMRWYRKIRKH